MTTTQIAVRLQDPVLAFIDSLVAAGTYTSRADAINAFAAAEQRRREDESDRAIYTQSSPDPELVAWAVNSKAHVAEVFSDLD